MCTLCGYMACRECTDTDDYRDLTVTTFADMDLILNPKLPPVNPKQIYGDKKPNLSLLPLTAQLAQWEAQMDGALKYGRENWRENPVEIMTYVDAARRHLALFEHGEQYARDTTVHNLGAVMACCAIIIDSMAHGTAVDNRNHSKVACDLLHTRGEEMVKVLKDMQREREAKRE